MTDRKATFAKRQREMEQKDRAKQREARRAERRATGGGGGPVIDWSAAHQQGSSGPDDVPADSGGIQPTPGRSEDSAGAPPGGNRDD
jgi:hypothetical protein